MTSELQFALKVLRRRARLFSRQIALAVLMTAVAAGFLTSAFYGTGRVDTDQRMSKAAP